MFPPPSGCKRSAGQVRAGPDLPRFPDATTARTSDNVGSHRAGYHDDLPVGLTMILPTMYGWIVQIYGYSPGVAKVCEKLSSVSSAADLKVPFFAPIRCVLSSSFFQVTVVPAVTVRVAGVKAKLSIWTVAGLAAAATTASPAAVSSGRAATSSAIIVPAPSTRPLGRVPVRRQAPAAGMPSTSRYGR